MSNTHWNSRKATELLTAIALVFMVLWLAFDSTAQPARPAPARATTQSATVARTPVPPAEVPVVNINTATYQELLFLPGVGPKLASAINDYNEQGGPECDHQCEFKTVDDLLKVKGIGVKKLEVLRKYVTINGATTATTKIKVAKVAK